MAEPNELPTDQRILNAAETAFAARGYDGASLGDIASIVRYLCGPGGEQITGQVLRVDGGQYL